MSRQLFTNNAQSYLSAGINSSVTLLACAAGHGTRFAAPTSGYFQRLTITDGTNYEIVYVTARSTDTFTVTRAQEGTSARSWLAGATLFSAATAGALNVLAQVDDEGDAKGSLAVQIQSGRSLSTNVASGVGAAVVGYDTKACYTGDVAVGNASKTTDDVDFSLWAASTAYVFGNQIRTASGTAYKVYECVKEGTSGGSAPSWTTQIVTDNTVIWRRIGVRSTNGRVAIGSGAISIAGIALGDNASTSGHFRAIAIRGKAHGANSIALQGTAYHDESLVIGSSMYSRAKNTLNMPTRLPMVGQFPEWAFGAEYAAYCGLAGVLMSEPLDLTGGATWAATTAYSHGTVVKPTVPNGYQYVRYDNSFIFDLLDAGVTYSPSSSGSFEPTWPTVAGDYVADGGGSWIAVQNSQYTMGTLPAKFVVEEVGIITYELSGLVVQPVISFGKVGNTTLFVNNALTTGLTAADKVQRWALTSTEAVDQLTFSVNTLATATKVLCRLYWKGFYIKHWL